MRVISIAGDPDFSALSLFSGCRDKYQRQKQTLTFNCKAGTGRSTIRGEIDFLN